MSTKTITKRIALVAVAALALGGISAVSANAADNTKIWAEIGDGLTNGDGTNKTAYGVAGEANTVTISVSATADDSRITVSGADATFAASSNDATVVVSKNGLSATVGTTAAAETLTINTPKVGTVTVNYFAQSAPGIYSATADETVVFTINATALAGGVKASTSTSLIKDGNSWGGGVTSDDTVVASSTATGNVVAVVQVELGRVAGAISASTKVKVSIDGPGTVSLVEPVAPTTLGSGRSLSSTVADTLETFQVKVYADGNSGVGTISISAGAFSSTEKVSFYGALASLKATVLKNARSGATTADAIAVVGYDKAGVLVPGVDLSITSGTSATIIDYAAVSSEASDVTAGTGTVDVIAVASKFGPVVLTIKDTDSKLISTTATVNVGAEEAATVTATFDKASYSGGDLAVLTITAKDKNGVPVGDSTADVAAAYSITTNGAVQGTIPTAANFKLGVQTIKFYVPLVTTTLKASIDLKAGAAWATAIDDTTITAEAAVEGDQASSLALDAANAATDAANNAYDEAQNATQAASDALAAVTALAAQVKSLIASVKKLTAAVAKLKK